MTIPKDPHMLASFINTKLRDYYPSLEALCDDLGADQEEILRRLSSAGYIYDPEKKKVV